MKILVVIPCLYGVDHTREAIESVINKPDVDLLLIDNGAEKGVKDLITNYISGHVNIFRATFEHNIYVNPAWQYGITVFLNSAQYTHLIIMNSDLIMQRDWDLVLRKRWAINSDEICIPVIGNAKHMDRVNPEISPAQLVHEGTPGVFITLSRKQVEIINPLPSECLVWFGDQWIYEILRECGYQTVIPSNLISYHYWSQNVQKVAGISEIIEEDKRQWEIVKHRKQPIIESNRIK